MCRSLLPPTPVFHHLSTIRFWPVRVLYGTIRPCEMSLISREIQLERGHSSPMVYAPQNPLIVQSDRSLLLEVDNSLYTSARDELARFGAHGERPGHISHTRT